MYMCADYWIDPAIFTAILCGVACVVGMIAGWLARGIREKPAEKCEGVKEK